MLRLAGTAALLLVGLAGAQPARAGGGPETTVVVVNADSPVSRRVANEYARLRRIPASHLIDVPGVPSLGIVPLETFRTRLWGPVKQALEQRDLLESTDLVAWSADFPFAVDVAAEAKEKKCEALQGIPFRAALTSLTYLWRRVEIGDAKGYLDLAANRYFRRDRVGEARSSVGFRSAAQWSTSGEPAAEPDPASPDRYVLSVMLGATGTFGNSADEVLACLERAAGADGTNPQGTVYLLANDDVRANTREPFFAGTLAALAGMGRKAEVLTKGQDGQDGVLPKGKADVLGAVLGFADFAWNDSGSRMLPGAIAEHLTSFGADFSHGGQTKISELLRHGAAGSSGTVTEPLALWQKFPVPSLHVHYAAGCSLAEAFYQSLSGPWQTLVVGDPLARPFARFAKVTITAPAATEPLRGTVEVRASVEPAADTNVGSLELWVDGIRRAAGPGDQILVWDTTKEDDGVHEVRVVAIEAGPIETRSFAATSLVVTNVGRSVTLTAAKGPVLLDGEVAVSGKAGDAIEVQVLCGARVLATAPVKAGGFRASVPAEALGLSSPPLIARARFKDGPSARSAPLSVDVEPRGSARTAPTKPSKPAKPPKPGKEKSPPPAPPAARAGLDLVVVDAKNKRHEGLLNELSDAALKQALEALKVDGAESIEIEGEIQIDSDGLYELVLQSSGPIAGRLGSVEFTALDASSARAAFVMSPLTAGWNPLRLVLDPLPAGTPTLSALLSGARVAAPILPAAFRR
jgi:uncharacterized protein (TIGR03790 family)